MYEEKVNDVDPNCRQPIHYMYIKGGRVLGTKARRLEKSIVAMTSSEVTRQYFINSIAPIKDMEGLYIPRVK